MTWPSVGIDESESGAAQGCACELGNAYWPTVGLQICAGRRELVMLSVRKPTSAVHAKSDSFVFLHAFSASDLRRSRRRHQISLLYPYDIVYVPWGRGFIKTASHAKYVRPLRVSRLRCGW